MIELVAKKSNKDSKPAYLRRAIDKAIPEALTILTERYTIPAGHELERFDFSTARRGAHFVPHKNLIELGCNNYLSTYKRKTVGEYFEGGKVDLDCALACKIVHELTHWVQYIEGRRYSEVETTENELALIRKFHPYWAKRIKTL